MVKKSIFLGIVFILFAVLLLVVKIGNVGQQNKPQVTPEPEVSLEESIATALSSKYSKSMNVYIVKTQVNDGNFAKGSVNFTDEQGGGIWLAAKTAKGWELAFDGNGIVDCESVDKFNFPTNIVPSCIDTSNQNELIQR